MSEWLDGAGERIVQLRARRNLTQAGLARAAGITRQSLNQIERNQVMPRVDKALRLARALECPIESLFGPREEPAVLPVHIVGNTPEEGMRLDLAQLDGRWIAGESDLLAKIGAGLSPADAVLRHTPGGLAAETSLDLSDLAENLFVAGCDPALALLCESASRHSIKGRCVWIPCGSAVALRRLAEGEVHLAGIHFGEDDEANLAGVKRLGLHKTCLVMRFTRWEQGWMIGRELSFQGFADLPGGRLRLANREAGSGCRNQLEEMMQLSGVAAAEIAGYDSVTVSHSDCARRIAAGLADVGLGCESIARVYGLRFIPLSQVAFDLVIRRDQLGKPLLDALIDHLALGKFVRSISQIPGYETGETGRLLAP